MSNLKQKVCNLGCDSSGKILWSNFTKSSGKVRFVRSRYEDVLYCIVVEGELSFLLA